MLRADRAADIGRREVDKTNYGIIRLHCISKGKDVCGRRKRSRPRRLCWSCLSPEHPWTFHRAHLPDTYFKNLGSIYNLLPALISPTFPAMRCLRKLGFFFFWGIATLRRLSNPPGSKAQEEQSLFHNVPFVQVHRHPYLVKYLPSMSVLHFDLVVLHCYLYWLGIPDYVRQ